eukprot:TRINITY_DN10428_c1_g1_i1.p2 TRINITY_DN10428_c1_g1~~TRINITY_DN10428_c1_g1_i1.p2  ORF type:complete len:213 (+),score=50.86 TRINITY_DN10428_c1_g1_i1:73-711(+)
MLRRCALGFAPQWTRAAAAQRRFRTARAEAVVKLSPELVQQLTQEGTQESVEEIMSEKGPVFCAASVGGTMAAKRAVDIVPLHTSGGGVERCSIDINLNDDRTEVHIRCTAGVSGPASGETEALSGAMVAALTVYDMCKSVSKDGMSIEGVKLVAAEGDAAGDGGRRVSPAARKKAAAAKEKPAPTQDKLSALIEEIQREEANAQRKKDQSS